MTSAFNWQAEGRPSIFATDSRFVPVGKQQKGHSQLQTESIARRTRETGRNPGTLRGISRKAAK